MAANNNTSRHLTSGPQFLASAMAGDTPPHLHLHLSPSTPQFGGLPGESRRTLQPVPPATNIRQVLHVTSWQLAVQEATRSVLRPPQFCRLVPIGSLRRTFHTTSAPWCPTRTHTQLTLLRVAGSSHRTRTLRSNSTQSTGSRPRHRSRVPR